MGEEIKTQWHSPIKHPVIQANVVQLSEEEQANAVKWGTEIYENKLKEHTYVRPLTLNQSETRYPVLVNIRGVASEIAVHKYFGLPYEHKLYRISDEGDIVLNGKVGDIKCPNFGCEYLHINKGRYRKKQYDFYILTRALGGENIKAIEIIGWIWNDDFQAKCIDQQGIGGYTTDMFAVHRNDLEKVEFMRDCLTN
jgi:hypothetical protein